VAPWRVHEYIDHVFFEKSYRRVHRKMDAPVKYLGRGHRILFHDPVSAYVIARKEYPHDDAAVLSALYHIDYDEICSRDPGFRKFLEFMAILDKKKKRRKRSKKKRKVGRKRRKTRSGDLVLRFKIRICG
jgi:hypothetical protein